MRKRLQHRLATFALLGFVSLAACNAGNNTTGNESAGGGTAGASQVSVTNPMPHPMNVMADWGQGEKDLGKVQPNETKTFDVDAPAGTEVKLTASDDAKTHSPSGTVTLSATTPATWTIK